MFPIPWNFPFRKKNGDLSTISDVINSGGGGGSDLPPHDVGDAGKLLGVDSAGKLEWTDDVSSEIQTLTNNVDVLIENGAINILQNNATTQIFRGVTFTVNNDGVITASGTQDGTGNGIYLHLNDTILGDGKKYKLSGCPSGGSDTSYRLYLWDQTAGQEVASDIGNGAIVTLISGHTYYCNLHIYLDYAISDTLIFKPMIADSDYSGDYVPYARTNRELTEDVGNLFAVSSRSGNVFDITIDGGYGGNDGARALIFGSSFIGFLSYYSSQWNYTGSIAIKEGQSITESNKSTNGLRLTLGGNADSINIVPINLGSSHFKISFVS